VIHYDNNNNQGFTMLSITNKTIGCLKIYISADYAVNRSYIRQSQLPMMMAKSAKIYIYIEPANCFIFDNLLSESLIIYHNIMYHLEITLESYEIKDQFWFSCQRVDFYSPFCLKIHKHFL
jgi:hypothetical protein